MYNIKQFKTKELMNQWLAKNESFIQYHEIFINNAYGVEYRKLRVIY